MFGNARENMEENICAAQRVRSIILPRLISVRRLNMAKCRHRHKRMAPQQANSNAKVRAVEAAQLSASASPTHGQYCRSPPMFMSPEERQSRRVFVRLTTTKVITAPDGSVTQKGHARAHAMVHRARAAVRIVFCAASEMKQ